MIKKLKYVIWYILLVIAILLFILFYQFSIPMLVNAYEVNNNSQVGSYQIKFNKDNYYDVNLLDTPNVPFNTNGVTYKVENNIFYIKGTTGNQQGPIFYNNLNLTLDPGRYTLGYFDLKINDTSNWLDTLLIYLGNTEWDDRFFLNNNPSPQLYTTFTLSESTTFNYIRCWSQSGTYDYSFKLMLYKGDYNPNINNYSLPFKFGYNVYASGTIKNITSSNITGDYYLNFCPEYLLICDTKKYTFGSERFLITPNNTISIDYDSNKLYVPYYINENGNISFNNSMVFTTSFPDNQVEANLKLTLIPIFQATPINQNISNNTIIMDYNYTFNSVSLSGIQLTSYGSNYNEGQYLKLLGDKYNKLSAINNNQKYYINNSYNLKNVVISDKLDTNYFFNEAYKMEIIIGDQNSDVNILSIDSFNLLINGNTNSTSPTINSNNNYEKYNTCSAWYDIPCQLGNGLTYVLYNAPVISPLIQLLKSMVDVITSIVTMIKWYEGLGILFGLFIFILMIRIIIMLLKGSNDDRGGKK